MATKHKVSDSATKRATRADKVPAELRRSAATARPELTIRRAISSGGIVSVGVLNLVKNTLIAVLSGARDVGGEMAAAAVTAARGAIRAASEIGADLGSVAKHVIMGTIEAAEEMGGELGDAAKSATRGAVRATQDVGGDVGRVAGKALEGTAEAARQLGADVEALVKSAAQGALEAADRIGASGGRAVRATVAEALTSVRALVGGSGRPPVTRPRRRRSGIRRGKAS